MRACVKSSGAAWLLLVLGGVSPARADAVGEAPGPRFRWDYRGHLSAAAWGDHTGDYAYAAGTDRVIEEHDGSMTYHISDEFEVRDGVALVYTRVEDRRVARQSQSALQPQLLEDLAPSSRADGRIDVGDAWIAGRLTRPPTRHLYAAARRLMLERTDGKTFLHHEQLGGTTLATAGAGRVVGECALHPTGEVPGCQGQVDVHGFTGQRRDPTTGLLHFGARELDPRAGRWLSPDPRFLTDDEACIARPFECANGFQYVMNNPVDLFDPTGEAWRRGWGWGQRSYSAAFVISANGVIGAAPSSPHYSRVHGAGEPLIVRTANLESLLIDKQPKNFPVVPGANVDEDSPIQIIVFRGLRATRSATQQLARSLGSGEEPKLLPGKVRTILTQAFGELGYELPESTNQLLLFTEVLHGNASHWNGRELLGNYEFISDQWRQSFAGRGPSLLYDVAGPTRTRKVGPNAPPQ
ncbi:MAG: RHS repeat-associated core domain-containing protein [Myxococcales bacterium]